MKTFSFCKTARILVVKLLFEKLIICYFYLRHFPPAGCQNNNI